MKKLAILLTILSTFALSGCNKTDLQTYDAKTFKVSYSSEFTAKADDLGIVTISNDKGKIEIGDFEPAGSPDPQPGMTQVQIDEFPKDIAYHGKNGGVASALFYKTGDEETMNKLKTIQETVELK